MWTGIAETLSGIAVVSCASANLAAGVPEAEWSVLNLHPAGASSSVANAVRGGQQAGTAGNAGLWSGSAASWVSLHPADALFSGVQGADGVHQVGAATLFGGNNYASLWSGTAGSWVNLHPAAGAFSEARAVCGSQQVGYVAFGFPPTFTLHAALWNSTAASWVDLHPPGMPASTQSRADATDCFQQAGYFRVGGAPQTSFRASVWTGTADSWVNLHPAAAMSSIAHGVDNGQQVGEVRIDDVQHASLWSGTTGSWVDLHPRRAGRSVAYSVHDGEQVGEADVRGITHACLWSSTAESWLDLHMLLPPDFSQSRARAIWHDGVTTYVVGWGLNTSTMRDEALMWVKNVSLTGDLDGNGEVTGDDHALLCSALGTSIGQPGYVRGADLNGDDVIDHLDQQLFNDILPPCAGDVVTSASFAPPPDGFTDAADLAYLLGAWLDGPSCADFVTSVTFAPPPDGVVDAADLAFLLGAWGDCE